MPGTDSDPFWKALFRPGGFAWSLRMRQGDPIEFFSHHDPALRAERDHWLQRRPEWCLVEGRQTPGMVESAWALAEEWGHVDPSAATPHDLRGLARVWEPDLIFYHGPTRSFAAACVCLPSSWDPRTWIRRDLDAVHGVVPRLQQQIGSQIGRFLERLRPGRAFQRENWSLSLGGELNFHPELQRPRLEAHTPLDQIYLRVEHQLFTGLPEGVLMGIRIRTCPLLDLAADPEVWQALAEKLRTMPDDVADYKSLLACRDPLAVAMSHHLEGRV
jgi:hypothetical protein